MPHLLTGCGVFCFAACCDTTCVLKPGAKCAGGECCDASCQFQPTNTICDLNRGTRALYPRQLLVEMAASCAHALSSSAADVLSLSVFPGFCNNGKCETSACLRFGLSYCGAINSCYQQCEVDGACTPMDKFMDARSGEVSRRMRECSEHANGVAKLLFLSVARTAGVPATDARRRCVHRRQLHSGLRRRRLQPAARRGPLGRARVGRLPGLGCVHGGPTVARRALSGRGQSARGGGRLPRAEAACAAILPGRLVFTLVFALRLVVLTCGSSCLCVR